MHFISMAGLPVCRCESALGSTDPVDDRAFPHQHKCSMRIRRFHCRGKWRGKLSVNLSLSRMHCKSYCTKVISANKDSIYCDQISRPTKTTRGVFYHRSVPFISSGFEVVRQLNSTSQFVKVHWKLNGTDFGSNRTGSWVIFQLLMKRINLTRPYPINTQGSGSGTAFSPVQHHGPQFMEPGWGFFGFAGAAMVDWHISAETHFIAIS